MKGSLILAGRTAKSPRDVHEFLRAKRAKREPVVLSAVKGASATLRPQSRAEFEGLLRTLESNHDFANAVHIVYALAKDLRVRGFELPLPLEVHQTAQGLALNWGLISCAIRSDGRFLGLIGGVKGAQVDTATREFIEGLCLKALEQGCRIQS